jgi:hypothetical protein
VRLRAVLALSAALVVSLVVGASAAGPGGWDHLGDGGAPRTTPLNGTVYALDAVAPDALYVGGTFTSAGGKPAGHIARWDGSAWSGVGPPTALNGDVHAIAYDRGKLYAGGTFTNAGGDAAADFLAVWDGTRWAPFCRPAPAFGGNVNALQVIGSTLYVGGSFQNGGGIASADYLLACDLNTGASRSTVAKDGDMSGAIYALTRDNNGTLYAAGGFSDLAGIHAADHVASYNGTWHAMGSGPGPGGGAVDSVVRSIASNGTDVYIGTDAVNVAGIPQADHVARWNGSAWSALGANTAGTDGWLPTSAFIYAIAAKGSDVVITGSFQNANGNPLADSVARFNGTAWMPLGSNGAGNGPWIGSGLALAFVGGQIVAGGNFSGAGGDAQASSIARYPLTNGPPPAPTNGSSVNVSPVSGTVLVKLPGQRTFTRLTAGGQVPVGSTVDATRGRVALVSARTVKGGTQSANLYEGAFVVRQRRGQALTILNLTGGDFRSCGRHATDVGPTAQLARRRPRRHVWGSGTGSFSTTGNSASATVRGTVWLTEDDCEGTLIRAKRGTVTVRDLVRRKTIILRAPHSYFAAR